MGTQEAPHTHATYGFIRATHATHRSRHRGGGPRSWVKRTEQPTKFLKGFLETTV